MAYKYNSIKDIEKRTKKQGDCWMWPTGSKGGYGQVYLGGGKLNQQTELAHRLSYRLANGSIKRGLQIDHLCRNTSCVNPDHLEAVTAKVNTLRSTNPAAQNAKREFCINGHEFGEQSSFYRLRGWRRCSTCHNEREKSRQRRLAAV